MAQTSLVTRPQEEIIILRPSKGWTALNLLDLWRYRELVYFLIWRDIKVRYKQTVLGAAWAVLQPLVTMVIFTAIFHHLGGINAPGKQSYVIFAFAGLLPWTLFQSSLVQSSGSIVSSAHLLS